MKLVYIDRKPLRLFTISDMAKALGVVNVTLWCRIRRDGVFPAPNYRYKNRDYYTADEFETLVQESAPVEERAAS